MNAGDALARLIEFLVGRSLAEALLELPKRTQGEERSHEVLRLIVIEQEAAEPVDFGTARPHISRIDNRHGNTGDFTSQDDIAFLRLENRLLVIIVRRAFLARNEART